MRAWKGNFEAAWELWVATDNYDDAPQNRDDNELPEGSQAPISPNFTSPFAGKTLEDCAKWLQQAPSEVAVNKKYFNAMDEHSQEDDTVLVCRIVDISPSGDVKLEYFPQPTDVIMMSMQTNHGLKFDEKALNYQRQRLGDDRSDRSRAGPYQ